MNRLNPFSAKGSWTGGSGTEIGYIKGKNTFRLLGTSTALVPGGSQVSQKARLKRGEQYTASAYVYAGTPGRDGAGAGEGEDRREGI